MITGFQEIASFHGRYRPRKDLFCGQCGHMVKASTQVKGEVIIKCWQCGEENVFKQSDPIRQHPEIKQRHYKRPIMYWAKRYNIPLNSCYMAFRRRDIRMKTHKMGGHILMSQREFLSYAIYTKKGQKIIHNLIKTGNLLTDDDINDNL